MTREYLVYRMDFPNGKSYIGSRWAGPLDNYWTSSKLVKNYIAVHGTDGITKTILCRCADKANALLCENIYQVANRVVESDKFYNLIYASNGHERFTTTGMSYSQATRSAIGAASVARSAFRGSNNPNCGGLLHNKPVEIVFKIGGRIIVSSARAAAEYLRVHKSNVHAWINGITRWRYRNLQSIRYLTPEEATEWKNGQNGC